MSEFGQITQQLTVTGDAFRDPLVEDKLKFVRDVNKALLGGVITRQEAAEYVKYLDQEWLQAGFMGEGMVVTGKARLYESFKADDGGLSLLLSDDDYNSNPEFVAEDKEMQSAGFIIEERIGIAAIKLLGVCQVDRADNGIDGQVRVDNMNYGIDIAMADIEFPEMMSYRRARAWLEEFFLI